MTAALPICDPSELMQRVRELYRGGLGPGDSTGWPSLDRHYTVAPHQWTLITGYPHSGKSEWLDALLVNLARASDWHFAMFSPENFPEQTHFAKLVEKFTGLPFGRGPNIRISEDELEVAGDWVNQRFMWLAPRYRTFEALLEAAVLFRGGSEKFGVVLDPWNALEHAKPDSMSESQYIGRSLTDLTCWVREAKLHCWIVAHPAKIYTDNSGKRAAPHPYDVAGSANWYNKADNIITVHRDQAQQSQLVELHVQKVRHKNIGRMGLVELLYDRISGRYFEPPPASRTDYANRDD